MLSIYTLAVLATAAVVSAKDDWKTSAAPSAAPTLTFALTLPADSSSDDWYPTTSASSYTSTVLTTTVYTVTACPTTITNCPVGAVTTETITSTTVICPLTSSAPLPPAPPAPATTSAAAAPPAPPAPASSSSVKVYPTTSALATSYVAPVYSANATAPYVKPTGTTAAKPSQFTGAANMVGGSLSMAAVIAFAVAVL
ncbi:hypothetical protein N431DRAFT_381595 [Stipitochalara longipes BDJ]|nr:hypothetical protein N431DRAFT_381595 [Stipitochalara longipes BDJ]